MKHEKLMEQSPINDPAVANFEEESKAEEIKRVKNIVKIFSTKPKLLQCLQIQRQ
jgi:hypothetical protein